MNFESSTAIDHITLVRTPLPAVINHRRDIALPGSLPTTFVEQETACIHTRATHQEQYDGTRIDVTRILTQITFAGTICMFVASTALTGNASLSGILVISAVSGVIGTLFAGAAAILAANGAARAMIAMRMLFLSCACGVAGALGIVAGTQTWEVTLIAGGCTSATLIVVIWRYGASSSKVADAEVGLPSG